VGKARTTHYLDININVVYDFLVAHEDTLHHQSICKGIIHHHLAANSWLVDPSGSLESFRTEKPLYWPGISNSDISVLHSNIYIQTHKSQPEAVMVI
jgi:hypothetical protein